MLSQERGALSELQRLRHPPTHPPAHSHTHTHTRTQGTWGALVEGGLRVHMAVSVSECE